LIFKNLNRWWTEQKQRLSAPILDAGSKVEVEPAAVVCESDQTVMTLLKRTRRRAAEMCKIAPEDSTQLVQLLAQQVQDYGEMLSKMSSN
jgi:transcription elongation factor Elf1